MQQVPLLAIPLASTPFEPDPVYPESTQTGTWGLENRGKLPKSFHDLRAGSNVTEARKDMGLSPKSSKSQEETI